MLNQRFEQLQDYPFQRLRELLHGLAPPAGTTPLAMSIGEPQHEVPQMVGDVLHANRHLYGKYPPTNSTPELRQAIAGWLARRYQLPDGMIDADRHVMPLAGTREGLFMIALTVVPEAKAGRRPVVAMPTPFYQCYAGAAVAAGAEPCFVPALAERRFLPDFAGLGEDVLSRAALVYLCSPANPQGSIADLPYLERMIELARAYDFVLAVDECYAEIYDAEPPPGTLEACLRLGGSLRNVLVFHSLSKRSSVPGLRSGFCAGDPELIAAFSKVRGYGGAPSPLPVSAAAAALWRDEAHVQANRQLYRDKLDIAQSIIGNRFGFYRPGGGFFLWLDVGDGEAAARKLYAEAGLITLPGRYLTREGPAGDAAGGPYLRVALVHDLATTRTALERLRDTLG